MKSLKSFFKIIIWATILFVLGFLAIQYVLPKFVERKTTVNYNFNPGQLRAQTKIVIWEQDFTLSFTEVKEKKYFNSDWLKFKESVAASAKGKMGFHIDLSDSVKTTIKFKNDTVYINTPLELTYVQIDLRTIEMIRNASLDPTLRINKDSVLKMLDQRAIKEFMPATIENIKLKTLEEQEKALSRLTQKPVKIKLSKVPTVQSTINMDWAKR